MFGPDIDALSPYVRVSPTSTSSHHKPSRTPSFTRDSMTRPSQYSRMKKLRGPLHRKMSAPLLQPPAGCGPAVQLTPTVAFGVTASINTSMSAGPAMRPAVPPVITTPGPLVVHDAFNGFTSPRCAVSGVPSEAVK